MRDALSLVAFGMAAMFGPMIGASAPWAPTMHALFFGNETWSWWPGEPHVAPAYLAMVAGSVIAWAGSVWFLVLASLHERMFEAERAAHRRWRRAATGGRR